MLSLTLVLAVLKTNSQVLGLGLVLQVQGLGFETKVLGEFQVPRICVKDFSF